MKLRKKLRQIPEAGLVILAKHAIPLLSRRAVVALSRFLGLCAYSLSPKLRNIASANINIAFGNGKSESEKREINRASFNSFSLVLLDLFWFSKHTLERLEKHVSYDASFKVAFEDPAAIFVSGHYGNWEVMALGCGCHGYPLTSIAMTVKNSFADAVLNDLRQKTGCVIVPREGALRVVMKALKSGRGVAIGIDQNTLPDEGGTFVPFFGLEVPVSNVIGVLRAYAKSKIFISWCIPDAKGNYIAYATKPLEPSEGDMTHEEVTAYVTHAFESVVRENPEFWLWSYKRWRFYRGSDDKEKFPFYAESYERYTEHGRLENRYFELRDVAEKARKAVSNSPRALKRKGIYKES